MRLLNVGIDTKCTASTGVSVTVPCGGQDRAKQLSLLLILLLVIIIVVTIIRIRIIRINKNNNNEEN